MERAAFPRSPGNPDDANADAERRAQIAELAAVLSSPTRFEELLPPAQAKLAQIFDAERATIYAVDPTNNQLFSFAPTGSELKEIRLPRETSSIAGFVAVARVAVNIRNVYDAAELARIHPKLKFDGRWDRASGFQTRSMLTVPCLQERTLLGIVQLINKREGQAFGARDLGYADEVTRLVGAALVSLNKAPAPRATRKATKWDRLVDSGALTAEGLSKALQGAAASDMDPARYLVEKVGVSRAQIEESLALFYGCDFYRFTGKESIPPDLRARLRIEFLKKICAAPVARNGPQLMIATDDPGDLERVDALRSVDPDREVVVQVGFRDEILACIEHSYGLRGDVGLILKELSADEATGAIDEVTDEDGGESDSAVIKLANQIIIDGYRRGASDIHIEPNGKEKDTVVRFRIDGDCVMYQSIPPQFRTAIVARLKIMAKLDISERRKPQDGKIKFRMADGQIELRVATLPTVNGNEDVVMRILAASKPIPLEEMGMSERNLRELRKILAKPYGLVLCVGPTGSGKTTTLHSALGSINTPDMKIWTAEDPVEITQAGLRQVQVQPKIGFDFAAAMRAFLRADPDVIMVGEMRDRETASIGIEASLTGHLVFSTLHTNSAPETITRLIDMEIDPFSFADALLGVLAQRLARGLCPRCKVQYEAADDEAAVVRAAMAELPGGQGKERFAGAIKLWRGRGCETCGNSGYKGRVALHELLITDDPLKHAIAQRSPVDELRKMAVGGGMTTLLQDGIEKAIAGRTDLKQVLAVCAK
jgi:type II secretory ATPase GspE/PulE/Tfp pilus assembly ATPase PilB-like protein